MRIERFSHNMEEIKVFFFYFDSSSLTIHLNRFFRNFLLLDSLTIELERFFPYIHSEERADFERKLISKQFGEEIEVRMYGVSGLSYIHFRFSEFPSDDQYTLVFGEDHTIPRLNELKVLEHNAHKNAILNILTHDLAGNLAMMVTLATAAKKIECNDYSNKKDEYLHHMMEMSRGSLSLIRNFLNREFSEAVSLPLNKKKTDMVALLEDVLEQYRKHPSSTFPEISFILLENPIFASVDAGKLIQIIHNLISNALKFTPPNGKVTISLDGSLSQVFIKVADTGIGIPASLHAVLFDKFTPAARTGLDNEVSNGLGMWIIKMLVEWHGGLISFESEENKGSSFMVTLPK